MSWQRIVHLQQALVLKLRGKIHRDPSSINQQSPMTSSIETYVKILWLQNAIFGICCRGVDTRVRHCKGDVVDHPIELSGVLRHIWPIDPATLHSRVIVQSTHWERPARQIRGNASETNVSIPCLTKIIRPVPEILHVIVVPISCKHWYVPQRALIWRLTLDHYVPGQCMFVLHELHPAPLVWELSIGLEYRSRWQIVR